MVDVGVGSHHGHAEKLQTENRASYRPASRGTVAKYSNHTNRPRPAASCRDIDDAVAAYVAKYVTKGASEMGAGLDHPISSWDDVESAPVSEHVRALMHTCWRLGALPEYAHLRLRA